MSGFLGPMAIANLAKERPLSEMGPIRQDKRHPKNAGENRQNSLSKNILCASKILLNSWTWQSWKAPVALRLLLALTSIL